MLEININWLAALAGVIVSTSCACGVIWKIAKPFLLKVITNITDPLTERIDDLESKRDLDYNRFTKMDGSIQAMLKALFVILETNESTEASSAKRKLQEHIIDR